MREPNRTVVAGSKTCGDWRKFRNRLVPGSDVACWEAAFHNYFQARISLRYLDPIALIQKYSTKEGEGFSIVAIHCTLVEFLESTMQGRNYRYPKKGQGRGRFEYFESGPLFVDFLSKRQPFNKTFNPTLAQDFYKNVRCGLLHEARTKNGWLIRAKSPTGAIVDAKQRILFRNNFHDALLQFVEWYGKALVTDTDIQAAFLRKFSSLCDC